MAALKRVSTSFASCLPREREPDHKRLKKAVLDPMGSVEGVGKPIAALRSCVKDCAFGPGRGALVCCDPNEAEL